MGDTSVSPERIGVSDGRSVTLLTIDSNVARGAWDTDQGHWVEARLCRQGEGSWQGLKLHPGRQQTLVHR
jgi:hypothetical protein